MKVGLGEVLMAEEKCTKCIIINGIMVINEMK